MSATTDREHLTRRHYESFLGVLLDAHRVLLDLEALAEGRTVLATDEYEFLTRRARRLVGLCVRKAQEQGR